VQKNRKSYVIRNHPVPFIAGGTAENSGCGEPHDISPEHEAKGFCAVCKNGGTQKTASPDTREIVDFTKGTDFGWIDYVVEDIEQDVKNTAQILQAGWRCPIPFTTTCFMS
jgi:hypothetical protein